MNKEYKKEKFVDRNEALIWCADNKPIYRSNRHVQIDPSRLGIVDIITNWQHWHKAIEIVPEKRTIEVWVNVYPEKSVIDPYKSKKDAKEDLGWDCIGTIKLSKEVTVINGKICDE